MSSDNSAKASSPSGMDAGKDRMTPEEARESLGEFAAFKRVPFYSMQPELKALEGQAFFDGVAYQEEKAKRLVDEVSTVTNFHSCGHQRLKVSECWVCRLRKALAHYSQGQEKNDGSL